MRTRRNVALHALGWPDASAPQAAWKAALKEARLPDGAAFATGPKKSGKGDIAVEVCLAKPTAITVGEGAALAESRPCWWLAARSSVSGAGRHPVRLGVDVGALIDTMADNCSFAAGHIDGAVLVASVVAADFRRGLESFPTDWGVTSSAVEKTRGVIAGIATVGFSVVADEGTLGDGAGDTVVYEGIFGFQRAVLPETSAAIPADSCVFGSETHVDVDQLDAELDDPTPVCDPVDDYLRGASDSVTEDDIVGVQTALLPESCAEVPSDTALFGNESHLDL